MHEQFEQATALIKQRRYDEARDILRTINDPKAQEWLRLLERRTTTHSNAPRRTLTAAAGGLMVTLVMIMALVLLLGGQPNMLAQDADALSNNAEAVDLLAMAQYFSDDTVLFSAARLDETFVDDLETLWALTADPLEELYLPALTLREALAQLTQNPSGVDVVDAFGDRAAIGARLNGSQQVYHLVVEVANQAAVDQLITAGSASLGGNLAAQMTRTEEDGNIVYTSDTFTITLSPTLLTMTDLGEPPASGSDTLQDAPLFQQAVRALPLDHYNILVFTTFDIPGISPQADMVEMITGIRSMASVMGGTILEGDTLVWDIALAPEDSAAQTVQSIDPEFAQYIPINSTFVAHGTNLSGLIDTGLTFAGQSDPNTDPVAQLEAALGMVGLDLQDDVLSWSNGDFAAFGRFESQDVLKLAFQSLNGTPFPVSSVEGQFDFGLVMETTDAEASERLITTLETLITQAIRPSDETTKVYSSNVGGMATTNILITTPVNTNESLPVELVMGSNDEIVFIMTMGAADQVLNAKANVMSSPVYNDSQQYWLSNPTSVWYTDANGAALTVAGPALVLSGPSIGNIFSNIAAGLNRDVYTPTPTPSPTPTPIPSPTPNYEVVVDQVFASFRHATITTTITDEGVHQMRLTLTFNP